MCAVRGTAQSGWLSGPILFCGQVGISAYARMASEGDTYCPVCIWLPSERCPRTFKGKVGLKVGLKWLSNAGHATGPSPRGSLGPGARQDKSRHTPTSKVSLFSLYCTVAQVHPPRTCPPNRTPTPTATMGKPTAVPLRMAEVRSQSPCPWPLPLWHHPPVPARCHPPPLAPAQEATRVGLPWPGSTAPAPMESAPSLFKLDPRGRRSQLQLLPHCHILPTPEVLLLLLQHPLWHWQQPQRRHLQDPVTALPKVVTGLPAWHPKPGTGCQPLPGRGDWGGGSAGEGKATAGLSCWGLGGEPTTPPSPPPLQLWATMAQVPLATRLALQPALPGQDVGSLLGQP